MITFQGHFELGGKNCKKKNKLFYVERREKEHNIF